MKPNPQAGGARSSDTALQKAMQGLGGDAIDAEKGLTETTSKIHVTC